MEDLIKGELDWHNKVNENFHEVDSQMAENTNKLNSMYVNVLYPPTGLQPLVADYNFDTKTGTDNTVNLQTIVDYVMSHGGGIVYFPPGNYLINGTVYTHNVNLPINSVDCPILFYGAFGSYVKDRNTYNTKLIKRTSGPMFGTNYNPNQNTVVQYPDVYTAATFKYLQFMGDGVWDTKWNQMSSTYNGIGIEMHLTRIDIQYCNFYGLDRGIYQPTWEGIQDNYCDKSTYKHLIFSNIALGCMNILHGDSSLVEDVVINTLPTCTYGIKIKGDNVRIRDVLSGGNLLNTALNILDIEYSHNIDFNNIYLENLSMTPINIVSSANIKGRNILLRHRSPTYGALIAKCDGSNGIDIDDVYYLTVNGMRLDTVNDTGDYTIYDTVSVPVDFDFTNTKNFIKGINIRMIDAQYISGVLTAIGERPLRITNTTQMLGTGRNSTITISASNSRESSTKNADYVCTGTNDDIIIQKALSDLNTLGIGGKIIFLEGTYVVNNTIYVYPNMIIEGQGSNTIFKVANSVGTAINVFTNSTTSDNNITIKNILIDGNSSNNSGGNITGIYLKQGLDFTIENVIVKNAIINGIHSTNSTKNIINKCKVYGTSGGSGIYCWGLTQSMLISNTTYLCSDSGISINNASTNNIIKDNISYSNGTRGLYVADTSSQNNINSNMCYNNSQTTDNTYANINISGSASYNSIQNNMCRMGNLTNKPKYGIAIVNTTCIGNLVTNNDLYSSGETSSFSDNGTSTVTTSGNRM